jgi:hypothetical protein
MSGPTTAVAAETESTGDSSDEWVFGSVLAVLAASSGLSSLSSVG